MNTHEHEAGDNSSVVARYSEPHPYKSKFPLPANATEDEIRKAIEHHVKHYPLSPLNVGRGSLSGKSDLATVWAGELGVPYWIDRPLRDTKEPEAFAAAIRKLLKEYGATLSDVARLQGVAVSTVSRHLKHPERLHAAALGNMLVAIATVTFTQHEPLEDAFIRVGDIVRRFIPTSKNARALQLSYELERLSVLLDDEALEVLANTARALMGCHIRNDVTEERLLEVERDIDNQRAFFNTVDLDNGI